MTSSKKIRYAVVGLGHIAQVAVLPAFKHAGKNSVLSALFSDDPVKREKLGARYRVPAYGYEEYSDRLRGGEVDAVYIALPNSLHADYTVMAARAGVHVLCEKPLAVTEKECRRIIDACERAGVRLMTAYRLHFEESNMTALDLVRRGKIGEPRYFNSSFSLQVAKGNIRLQSEMGGGTLYDIGIYCINAARYLFQAEPVEVAALSSARTGERFGEVDEATGAVLRFPGDRLASFVTSFGASPVANFQIVGTRGNIFLEQCYEYVGPRTLRLTVNEKTQSRTFSQVDQFAPELVYFSDCILHNKKPQPSGAEGLEDVRIIEALYRSARTKRPVALRRTVPDKRPSKQRIKKMPPVRKPELVHAASASGS